MPARRRRHSRAASATPIAMSVPPIHDQRMSSTMKLLPRRSPRPWPTKTAPLTMSNPARMASDRATSAGRADPAPVDTCGVDPEVGGKRDRKVVLGYFGFGA